MNLLNNFISYYWTASEGAYRIYLIVLFAFIPCLLLGIWANYKVQHTFNKYSTRNIASNRTAKDIAREILNNNELSDVNIVSTAGSLTDYYDPQNHVLALSQTTEHSSSVAAIGVACHEVGHAIQYKKRYLFATLRTMMVPVLNFSNQLLWPIFAVGCIFGLASPYTTIGYIFIWVGVIIFAGTMIFSLLTLPTEINASRRAMKLLREGQYMNEDDYVCVRQVLTSAALTYVASFLMSMLQFLRLFALLIMAFNRHRDD